MTDAAELADRIQTLLVGTDHRLLVGITGPPGAGKTTLVRTVLDELGRRGVPCAWVPMDGFHLADVELDRLGRRERKGAFDTFDGHGYLATLLRLRTAPHTVYAPGFERDLEQPIAGAIAVEPSARVVLTEGNYLLDLAEPWPDIRKALDEVWFCDVDGATRRERLVRRHVEFGKPEAAARAWVDTVDQPNAVRVVARRDAADLLVTT